jgi:hypothetical protein
MLVSGIKGESFPAEILQKNSFYFQDRTPKIQFLLVPEAVTNLFGRDLMTRLGISLHIKRDKIQAYLNLFTLWG